MEDVTISTNPRDHGVPFFLNRLKITEWDIGNICRNGVAYRMP